MSKDQFEQDELIPLSALSPVRVLRDGELVKVRYQDAEFNLSARKPFEVVPVATNDDLPMVVEVMDPQMLLVRQVGEDGETQTLCLTPQAAIQLANLIDSFLFFPEGLPPPND